MVPADFDLIQLLLLVWVHFFDRVRHGDFSGLFF